MAEARKTVTESDNLAGAVTPLFSTKNRKMTLFLKFNLLLF